MGRLSRSLVVGGGEGPESGSVTLRGRAFRLTAVAIVLAMVGGMLAVVGLSTPAFAAATITESPSGSTTWATDVPYGQTNPAPTGPGFTNPGTATAPAGITLTAKGCAAAVTSTSGAGGTAGFTIAGVNSAGIGAVTAGAINVLSYGASNSATTSTGIVGQTAGSPSTTYTDANGYLLPGSYTFTFEAWASGVTCITSTTYTLTVAQAAVSFVGGGGSGSNIYIYDDSYNQSNGQNIDVVDSDTSGMSTFAVNTVTGGTGFGCYGGQTTAPNTDPYPNTPPVDPTPYDHECNLQAAQGDGDDSGVVGAAANASPSTITLTETDPTYTNTSPTYNANVYNPPLCAVAPDGTGSLAGTLDTTYATAGDPTDAEACAGGAGSGPYNPATNPASTLLTGISPTGGTIYTGSNPIDAGGGTALTIMTGPGFNWTGGVGSGEADVDTGTAGLNKQAWSGATTSSAPPSTLTSTSTVASEASFKSSGDPNNTCPPPPALIDAGLPFCFEEFETTGAGPSAAQAALDYTGQSVPTTTTPTVALNQSTDAIGSSVQMTDASGACPSTIGAGTTNFFNGSYNCWYGRAGDPTPVTATIGGDPVTVTPTLPATADVSEGNYTVGASSTITLVTVTGGQNTVTTTASSAGTATTPYNLVGYAVSGTDIPVGTEVTGSAVNGNGTTTFTLSNNATATPAAETLTFYPVVLTPPQLNASFTIPAGTPTGPQTLEVCEPTTPNNGNDWEFGVQWMQPSGSLQYVSGDSGPTEVCGSTPIDVTQASSSTTTTAASTNTVLGDSNTDGATVTGSLPGVDPTGSVDFYECGPTANPEPCTSASWTQFDTESLSGTANPDTVNSAPFTPDAAGTWCFAAVYSGDGNYSGSSDETTTNECFDVGVVGSSTVTTPANPTIDLGNSNTDAATVTGSVNTVDPTGSVNFYECGPTGSPVPCNSGSWTQFDSENLSGSANPDTVTSAAFTPDADGTWCFAAVYSGDGNYSGSSDQTTDECFTVVSAPDAPSGVSATAGNAQASVSFGTPFDGGSTIEHYTVTANDVTHPFNGGQVVSGSSSPIPVTGLTNGDTYNFTVTATNAIGTGPASMPSNNVTPTTLEPTMITSADTTAVAAKGTVNFSITATGSPAPTITESGALPAWLKFKGGTAGKKATLTGTAPADSGGAYSFTVEASNGVSPPVYQSFTVNVLQITSGTTASATANQPFTFDVTTSDTPANPTLTATGLPAGLTFMDNGNGTGVINGPATSERYSVKTYKVKLKATSGSVVAKQTLSITVHS